MREKFDIPEKVLIEPETGLALNIPAAYQEWPGWWNDDPVRYATLRNARTAAGIEIDDFPDGTSRIVERSKVVPMKRSEYATEMHKGAKARTTRKGGRR